MAAERYDVIVAGLGAFGSAVTYHFARSGVRVLGIDRYTPPHPFGSSHGQSRIIRQAYFEHPMYVPLVQRAYRLWRELEDEAGEPLLRITGGLMLGLPESAAVAGSLRSAREHAIAHEQLTAAEIRSRFPVFQATDDIVGLYEPNAGVLYPERSIAAHLSGARAAGATLRLNEPLTAWTANARGVEVSTANRRYSAGALVFTIGPWLPHFFPALPLRVTRQVQLWFRRRGPLPVTTDALPVFLWEIDQETAFYGLGGLGDGAKVARHHGGEEADAANVDREVRAADAQQVRSFLRLHAPALEGELVRGSVCLYTNTPDGHFLIDRAPEHENVWIVSPCSGHGFKFAPAIGADVAASVIEGRLVPGLAAFGLARLTRQRSGRSGEGGESGEDPI